VDGLVFPSLIDSQHVYIEHLFFEGEFLTVLQQCFGDKAPGAGSMTISFLQDNWDPFKEDILRIFREFHRQGSLPKASMQLSSILSLSNLVLRSQDIKDNCLISFVGCVHGFIESAGT